jgi:hypothetical protein
MKNAPTIAVILAVAFIAFAVGYTLGFRSGSVEHAPVVAATPAGAASPMVVVAEQRQAAAPTPIPRVFTDQLLREGIPRETPPPQRVSATPEPVTPLPVRPLAKPDPVQIFAVRARPVSADANWAYISWQVDLRNVTAEQQRVLVEVRFVDANGFQVVYNESMTLAPGQVTSVTDTKMMKRVEADQVKGVEGNISGYASIRGVFQ